MQPQYELADVLNAHWQELQQSARLNSWQWRTLDAVRRCRTAGLGAHVDGCTSCGHLRISYNSCRNRHCPKCQGAAAKQWLAERAAELLPVPYFHLVFTLPAPIADIAYQNKAVIYDLLFKASAETLITIQPIPSTSARASLSSPSCTPGARQ